jgi:hypothetical protein
MYIRRKNKNCIHSLTACLKLSCRLTPFVLWTFDDRFGDKSANRKFAADVELSEFYFRDGKENKGEE